MVDFPSRPPGVVINGAEKRGWGTGWPHCQPNQQKTIRLNSGLVLTVRHEVAELITLLLDEVERRGYDLLPEQTGGYNCRQIFHHGKPTGEPSNHSWGLAVDLNWNLNPAQGRVLETTNIPPWLVSFMWSFGFFWGGWYKSDKDPMHFEFAKTPSQAEVLTNALRTALGQQPTAIGDDMFNPFFVQVQGQIAIFIVTSGGVLHVKNPTHLRFLVKGGVPEAITFVTDAELAALLERE